MIPGRLAEEAHTFLTAVTYFTRLPSPLPSFSEARLARCAVHLPLIGWLVGGCAVLVYLLAQAVLPKAVAVLLSMSATAWLTGALHEDGWADFCDGFGGGWSKERILEIMKDPRIGAYGAMGLWLMLTLKFLCLGQLPAAVLLPALGAGHAASRFFSASLIFTHAYVGTGPSSKAGALCTRMSRRGLLFLAVAGLLPLLLFRDPAILLALLPMACVHGILASHLARKIGGYTGDCLGAAQQLSEITFYLFVLGWPWTST